VLEGDFFLSFFGLLCLVRTVTTQESVSFIIPGFEPTVARLLDTVVGALLR
jgi:hypothetical protein